MRQPDEYITVCIVDDEEIIIHALKLVISNDTDILVTGTFNNAEDFIKEYPEIRPDITIMDLDLPGISGIDAILAVKSAYPEAKFLVITNFNDEERLFSALKAGADGYLLKKDSFENVIPALRLVHEGGGAPMTQEIAKKVVQYFHRSSVFDRFYKLTEKEKIVIQFLVDGLLYKEIADKMLVTIDAIKKHTQHIYEKMQVRTRSEAIKKYLTDS